jgi:hypothetical protein
VAQYPKQIQAAVLFDRVKPFPLEKLVDTFIATDAATGVTYNRVFDTKPGVFYRLYGTNNAMITVEYIEKQAHAPLFETALSTPFTQRATPDARARIARHRSHILVNVQHGVMPQIPQVAAFMKQLNVPQDGHSLRDFQSRLLRCGAMSAIAHTLGDASLVHWTTTDHLLTGKDFAQFAMQPAPSLLHIHPLILQGGRSADRREQVQIKTFGAAHFIDREIHLLPSPLPAGDGIQTILAFLKIATADKGYIIPDGSTFGPDLENCYRVRHIPEGAMSGELKGPLYQIEVLRSHKHGYTSPDYIAPERTFDDRNVPADVLEELGDKRQAVVQEWRDERQMAEAVGGEFRVKQEMPGSRSGLGAWLPFGKRKAPPQVH